MLLEEGQRHRKLSRHLRTYQADSLTKIGSGRKFIQNGYGTFEGLHDFIFSPEFAEGLCLFTKKGGNGIDGVAALELLGKWMVA